MNEEIISFLSVLGMIAAMCLIFAAAYFVSRFAAKQPLGLRRTAGTGQIQIMERVTLGKNLMLCVVKAADKTLLLGVTEKEISLLCELPAQTEPPATAEEKEETPDFLHALIGELQAGKGKKHGNKQDKHNE